MNLFLPVLAYQKIGHPAAHSRQKNRWTSVRALEKLLACLGHRHYTFITPKDLQHPLPAKPVMLAFMGGYQPFYTDVFPLLKKYNARATVFVATDTLGTYDAWQNPEQDPWQNVLTTAQLTEMCHSGLVEVGTLGLTGENLLACEEASRARGELLESVHRLKMLHKIEVCAVGFWPDTKDKNLIRTRAIGAGLNLPVITSLYGKNSPGEKVFLKVLRPGLWNRWLLSRL